MNLEENGYKIVGPSITGVSPRMPVSGEKKMKISCLLKGCIYEVSFGYNTNLGGYTTLMSDILKLYEIYFTRGVVSI